MSRENKLKSLVIKMPLIKHFIEIRNDLKRIKEEIIKSNINDMVHQITQINIDNYINKYMYENPKYQNTKKLNKFEYQVFSQSGEDGIIAEIFKRIGTANKFFVEFGAEKGTYNNTTHLLLKNWTGVWIEADPNYVEELERKFGNLIRDKKLILKEAFITPENIETILKETKVPEELDLLSIDIDGNDYWIWKAIKGFHPRVVVIEYNALMRPDIKWVMKYNHNHRWNESCYFGASLKSLEILAFEKGYRLVGCDFIGINAFFVREDLLGNNFLDPFTAENHYEPPRYFLLRQVGYRKDFGDFESE